MLNCIHQTKSQSVASTFRPTNYAANPWHCSKHQPTPHGEEMSESRKAWKEP